MAAEIKQALGVEPQLVRGANGVFDVVCDGALVFSRHREARFPEPNEVVRALKALKSR